MGKGGSRISEIRFHSGCHISIAKLPDPKTGDRIFTITGTPESIEKARYMLSQQIETEKLR